MVKIVAITWQDAAYSFEQELPEHYPSPRVTFGTILKEDDQSIFIATNLDSATNTPVDGFVIPKGVLLNRIEIGSYE